MFTVPLHSHVVGVEHQQSFSVEDPNLVVSDSGADGTKEIVVFLARSESVGHPNADVEIRNGPAGGVGALVGTDDDGEQERVDASLGHATDMRVG